MNMGSIVCTLAFQKLLTSVPDITSCRLVDCCLYHRQIFVRDSDLDHLVVFFRSFSLTFLS